ncbi:MAG: hypothetical protein GY898_08815 [Proteobacteria bacterium]|nr:hypothetical protein [Pseudomonadota bacterium]
MAGLGSIPAPLKRRLKLRLAGTDVDALVTRRDRRRLRWLASEADDPGLRFRALRSVAEILDPDADRLFFALIDAEAGSVPPAEVRIAAEGLGRLIHGDADEHLRRLLADNRPAAVQLAAARALATLGRDKDWAAVRAWAVRCSTETPLFPDLRDCPRPTVDEPAGVREVVLVMETLYADKDARWWSSKAARWLASEDGRPRMASNRGADKIVAQAHREALNRRELDDAEFRRVALHLGSLARERDQQLLVDLVRAQSDAGRRRAVIQAIGLRGDPRSVPLLNAWCAEVPDGDTEAALDLARAVGRLGWADGVSALIALRGRFADPEVRLGIAWAVGECGGEEAVRFLIELVRSRTEELSEDELAWIARALKRCGVIGREAIRGSVAIARAGGGERDRVRRLAELAGIH